MDAYSLVLYALCIWREARGEVTTTQEGVAWVIRNRVNNPGWWGHTFATVILMHAQFSSFNRSDLNSTLWPLEDDPVWLGCLRIANEIGEVNLNQVDITDGAVNYYDKSMDLDPPTWATDGSMVHTVDLGRLHFYRLAVAT